MEIEVGKSYKDSRGNKIEIVADFHGGSCWLGIIRSPCGDLTSVYKKDGTNYDSNLVSEWKNPVKVSGWLVLNKNSNDVTYYTDDGQKTSMFKDSPDYIWKKIEAEFEF